MNHSSSNCLKYVQRTNMRPVKNRLYKLTATWVETYDISNYSSGLEEGCCKPVLGAAVCVVEWAVLKYWRVHFYGGGGGEKWVTYTLKTSMKEFSIDPASWETLAHNWSAWSCIVGDAGPQLVSLILHRGRRWPTTGQLDPALWETLAHNWSAWSCIVGDAGPQLVSLILHRGRRWPTTGQLDRGRRWPTTGQLDPASWETLAHNWSAWSCIVGDAGPQLVSLILHRGRRWPTTGQLDPALWETLAHNWSAWSCIVGDAGPQLVSLILHRGRRWPTTGQLDRGRRWPTTGQLDPASWETLAHNWSAWSCIVGDAGPQLVSLILHRGRRWPTTGQLDPASWETLAHNWSAWSCIVGDAGPQLVSLAWCGHKDGPLPEWRHEHTT